MYVSRFWRDNLRPLKNFPKQIQTEIDRNSRIGRKEVADIETFGIRRKHPKSVEESDDGKEDEAEPRRVRLKGRLEDECVAIDALSVKGSSESKICD